MKSLMERITLFRWKLQDMNKKIKISSITGIIFCLFLSIPAFAATVQYTYTYDSLNRLTTRVDHGAGAMIAYTYDFNGNRLTKTETSVHTVFPGDINDDGNIDLTDAILALHIVSGIDSSQNIYRAADVNGDGKTGIQEVIYIFQKISGYR